MYRGASPHDQRASAPGHTTDAPPDYPRPARCAKGVHNCVADSQATLLPTRAGRTLCLRGSVSRGWALVRVLGQDLCELLFEPGMQDGIGHRDHSFGPQLAAGRTEQGQQFGGPSSLVLVWLQSRVAFGLPRGARLWDGRIRPCGSIFVQLHDPGRFCLLVGQLDQSFFSASRRHRWSRSRFCALAARSQCAPRCGCAKVAVAGLV